MLRTPNVSSTDGLYLSCDNFRLRLPLSQEISSPRHTCGSSKSFFSYRLFSRADVLFPAVSWSSTYSAFSIIAFPVCFTYRHGSLGLLMNFSLYIKNARYGELLEFVECLQQFALNVRTRRVFASCRYLHVYVFPEIPMQKNSHNVHMVEFEVLYCGVQGTS